MSPHHSDQISGKPEVNWIVFVSQLVKSLAVPGGYMWFLVCIGWFLAVCCKFPFILRVYLIVKLHQNAHTLQ